MRIVGDLGILRLRMILILILIVVVVVVAAAMRCVVIKYCKGGAMMRILGRFVFFSARFYF